MSCCESFPSTEQPGSSGNGRPLSRGQGGPGGSVSAPVTPKTLSLHGSLEGSPAQVRLLPLSRFPHLGFPRPFPRRGDESKPSLRTVGGRAVPFALRVLLTGLIIRLTGGQAHGRKPKYISIWGSMRVCPRPTIHQAARARVPSGAEERGLWSGASEGRRQVTRSRKSSCLASRCELGHL